MQALVLRLIAAMIITGVLVLAFKALAGPPEQMLALAAVVTAAATLAAALSGSKPRS